eukprot:5765953-Karenia_brevis.AAC.1
MTKWIQEIERVAEDSMGHMEELDLEEYGEWTLLKPHIKMRWVDTNKSFMKGRYDVRSRMVAKIYKGRGKGRDDLFAESFPLEAK